VTFRRLNILRSTTRQVMTWCWFFVGAFGGGHLQGAPAQSDFSIQRWQERAGLPSEDVAQITQDEHGYLWVATTSGLARFDGSRFRVIRSPTDDLRQSRGITNVAWSGAFGVVVALESGGVQIQRDASLVPAPFSDAVGTRQVIGLFAEKSGTLWIGCADGIVFRCAVSEIQTFTVPRGLPGARRISFATDSAARLWVCSDLTLLRYENQQLIRFPQDFGNRELRIGSSHSAGPWVVGENQLLQWKDDAFHEVTLLPTLLGAHYLQAMLEDRRGGLWLATRSQGLQYFSKTSVKSLPELGDEVVSLWEDDEGSVWAGTHGAGLARVRPKPYRLFNKASGLLVDSSATVCEDRNGDLWFANRDGGVVRWSNDALTTVGPLPDWPTYSAVSVFPLAEGGVGFTCGAGAYRVPANPQAAITKIESVPSPPIIRCTYSAENGDVWMALPPDKLGRLRGGELQTFSTADGLPGAEVRSIAETAAGEILVGTAIGELLRWDGQRYSTLLLGSQLRPNAIQAIWVDPDQRIWLGTERQGVLSIDPRGQTVGRCDMSHGLVDNNITQIIADDFGFLWFGSAAGVFRVSRESLRTCLADPRAKIQPTLIASDAGATQFAGIAQYQPGVCKSRTGKLWFATRRGVLQVDPTDDFIAPAAPRVSIDEVRSGNRMFSAAQLVTLGAADQKLEIHFSTLCLSAPELLRVRYRLEGHDADWQEALESRTATYSRLPAGTYTFYVEARLADGSSREAHEARTIIVSPQWWQTWWFQSAALFVLLALVVQIVRGVSNRRLRKKLERAERAGALERERARIARDIHDDLGASLSRVSLLTQEARQHADPTHRGYFGQIYETVSQITRSMDEIVWAIDPRYDDLDGLASYLVSYAQEFLSVADLRCRLDVPDRLPTMVLSSQQRHHIFLGLKEALNNVVKHARATEVTIAITVKQNIFTMTVTDNGGGLESKSSPTSDDSQPAVRTTSGHGLANMKARMGEVAGKCHIGQAQHGGTVVVFELPITTISRDA
jgi:signal transduction histidine kinase/ligand-binding sensor domain-containing protein